VARRLCLIFAAAAGVLLVGWGLFHPDFHADPGAVSAAVRQELAGTGFRATKGITAAQFESTQSIQLLTESATSEQSIVPIDDLITQKRSLRRTKGSAEEFYGFYVGPLTVVRFYRTKPPIIGELLPFHFWSSSHMTAFIVEEANGFPATKGGKLQARVTYEERYADGQVAQTERRRLYCNVAEVVAAATIDRRLPGAAARIECREQLEADGRTLGPAHPQTWSEGDYSYAHWYVLDHHWSIAIEGEVAMTIAGSNEIRRWTAKLRSFDMAGP
jgi:hypothetical protein